MKVKILKIMNFTEFTRLYPYEDSCIKHFRDLKEKRAWFVHSVDQQNFIGARNINLTIARIAHTG